MKKTVILILIILPIFLLITISFAGRIFSTYLHVSVDKVEFTDQNEDALSNDHIIKVNINESVETFIKVYPELASIKTVKYFSSNTNIFTVDKQGKITGVSLGEAYLKVESDDSAKTDTVMVKVTAERVIGVTLSHTALTITEGEKAKLTATVEIVGGALNKNVTYTSSNLSVATVDSNGNISAINEGETTITVTTEDGGHTAECIVTVVTGTPTISFNFSLAEDITLINTVYNCTASQINLNDYLSIDQNKIEIQQVNFAVISGSVNASLSNGILTFTNANKIIILRAFVGDDVDNPTYFIDIKLILKTTE